MPGSSARAKWVYRFGGGAAEGGADMSELLGGKGANLAEMSRLGLPVPPGFTISASICSWYFAHDKTLPPELRDEVWEALAAVEQQAGATFGDRDNPLLLSVRSGARASMPGMMNTVLNLGLNDETVEGLARHSGDPRFAYDSYRRFIDMYADVVLGIEHHLFEEILELEKEDRGVRLDTELSADDLRELVEAYKEKVKDESGQPFPQNPKEQLWGGIAAIIESWNAPRAITYRRLHHIPEDWGTAVNVQTMVFGNMGDDCATGVAFTRDPSTGEKVLYGEYLVNAQGEDVVAGIRTPQSLTIAARKAANSKLPAMEEVMPEVFAELQLIRGELERHYRDVQDIEFTVQKGRLYMLQTRVGKRSAKAAIRIAVDMVAEGLITRDEALMRVDPASLDQLLHRTLDPAAARTVIARGLPASPGAASGIAVFDSDAAVERGAREGVILVRLETSPEDIHGMHAARGILTARGGMTSHAAVVARGMGRPCVAGAADLRIDYAKRELKVAGRTVKEGDTITIDGSTGEMMLGEVPTTEPKLSGEFATLMAWADEVRRLGVRANAETPEDAATARRFGAEGIGLCRTEHMFFAPERIVAVREMIMADDPNGRQKALAKIMPMQRGDFIELFRIMRGLPVTIRLLDPPLHEFLPKTAREIDELAVASGKSADEIRARAVKLAEVNPMLGLRGCRLGISHPEIYEMQTRAIFEAALAVKKETGETVEPNIMIPLVALKTEIAVLKKLVDRVAADVRRQHGVNEHAINGRGGEMHYTVGTMIELPRAALCAGEIAEIADFFSFGTNDLTQTTYGLSRDDAGGFLKIYEHQKIIDHDPFMTLDVDGVGELVRIACRRGRKTKPDLELGICGEHGGDPASIRFCEEAGLDYVSCSPYRVVIARLAAAQARLSPPGEVFDSD
jgi:pyruvate,orthophosphate dikinase